MLISFLFLGVFSIKSQNKTKLHVFSGTKIKTYKIVDSVSGVSLLTEISEKYHEKGFWEASVDSFIYDSIISRAYLSKGLQYKWNEIQINTNNTLIPYKYLSPFYRLKNKKANYKELNRYKNNILTYLENSGYPFASIFIDTLYFYQNLSKLSISIQPGSYIAIDSIVLKGETEIASKYLFRYLSIYKDMPYNEQIIQNIDKKISTSLFLETINPSEIEFHKKNADLYLFLKNKKANSFRGVLGFMPNENVKNKLLLTGEVFLNLSNSFNRGENINFEWKKLEESSQKLNFSFYFPYWFGSGINTKFVTKLRKQDSTYLNVHLIPELSISIQSTQYFFIRFENEQSIIVNSSDKTAQNNLYDYTKKIYGLGMHAEKLDYKFNPTKGYLLDIYGGIGKRADSDSTNIQYKTEGMLKFYQKLFFPQLVWASSLQWGGLIGSNLSENELFKIGGLNTIRGFDQESLSPAIYGILSNEIRFLPEKNSAFYFFYDFAYYQKTSIDQQFTEDYPRGFGVGIDFQTKAGIFTLNYAVGKQFDNPYQFQTAKIHFGFTSYF